LFKRPNLKNLSKHPAGFFKNTMKNSWQGCMNPMTGMQAKNQKAFLSNLQDEEPIR
jgi:hypothetical protein